MKSYALFLLLASTALGAGPALAQDASVPDANIAADGSSASQSAPSAADMETLRAQIQAMQAQLDRLQQQASATPAAAPAAAPANAAPAWFANTTVGGKAYFNVSNISQKSDGLKTNADGFQTDVKRFYLVVDHKFNDIFSANLTTDFNYVSNDSETQLYVKKAYLQAKLSDAFFVRIGSADLPWVPFTEDLYGYRFVENTLIDRTKYGTSADYGVHVGGTFGKGLLSYAVSAINGAGYKTLRRGDSVDFEGRVSLMPVKGLTFAVGGYTGKLGNNLENVPVNHRATRVNALVAYTNSRVRVGVEYFSAKDWNNVKTVTEDKTSGVSAFGSFAFTPRIALFGRYDKVNPNKLTNAPADDDYFNVGIDFQPIKNIDLALVYKRERVDNLLLNTSNGTIGGVNNGTYDEIGLFSQVKF